MFSPISYLPEETEGVTSKAIGDETALISADSEQPAGMADKSRPNPTLMQSSAAIPATAAQNNATNAFFVTTAPNIVSANVAAPISSIHNSIAATVTANSTVVQNNTNNVSRQPVNIEICKYYRRGDCRHGQRGKTLWNGRTCNFRHPRKCMRFCKFGNFREQYMDIFMVSTFKNGKDS